MRYISSLRDDLAGYYFPLYNVKFRLAEGYTEAFTWIWLPGETKPVVAGKLSRDGSAFVFTYGQSYLERGNAIPIYDVELPLKSGILPLLSGLSIP